MMDTSVTLENLRSLANITKIPKVDMYSDKRSAFNYIHHVAIMDAAMCYGWGKCLLIEDMLDNVQFRLRMNGLGVSEYARLAKGVVQGSKVGSKIYAAVENMFTKWVEMSTPGFTCAVQKADGTEASITIHTQTHMDDMVDVVNTKEEAKVTQDLRNLPAAHYQHPFAAEKGMIIAKDEHGAPDIDVQTVAWEAPDTYGNVPVMDEEDTMGYEHGGFCADHSGLMKTGQQLMEKSN